MEESSSSSLVSQEWDPTKIPHDTKKRLLKFYHKVVKKAPTQEQVQGVADAINALLGGVPIVGVAIQATAYIIQCVTQAETNISKKEDILREANFVKEKLDDLEGIDPNISQSFQTQALEILATSCALAEATRARWFDPILVCVCVQCNATALDEQATQLSNLLNKIALQLQILMAYHISHFDDKISPVVPDQSSVIRRRDKVINFLKRQEEEGSELVRVVGIHGVGGLGKTTIMHAMEAHIRPLETHSIAFVHVGEKPSKPLHELQSDLIYQLSGDHVTYQSTSHGKTGFIKCMQCLKEKQNKACIFIDDVWEKSQLHDLLPGELGGITPPSSYLIISSRFKLVVDELDSLCSLISQSAEKKLHAYEEYNPELLDVNEAEDLFVKNAASRGLNLLPAHEQLVHNIVPLCGGLPLLLVAYSSYFSSNSKRVEQEEWEAVADKLRSAQDFPGEERVFKILKASIDRLH